MPLQEGNEYVKKLCHFHCKCKDDHECFVYTCRSHLYNHNRLDGMQLSCTCKQLDPYENQKANIKLDSPLEKYVDNIKKID